MQKIGLIFVFLFSCATCRAETLGTSGFHFFHTVSDDENPFFGGAGNQVALHLGEAVDYGFIMGAPNRFVPYISVHMQYSQPATFFRLPSRQSLNVSMNLGFGNKYGWKWNDFTIPIAYLSEDVILATYGRFYTGLGAGAGMQMQQNARIGSKLLFQFKWFLGYGLSDNYHLEVFAQHFSNGTTTPQCLNNSYNLWGVGVVYNF
ncbi:MAG: hypothetical protein LBK26_02975 [Rickettsiales bacterium]|nr:hypothetical protein [Rickettsiales bacterium]